MLMDKYCSVIKQRIVDGAVVKGEKAYLVAYFPRTKEQMRAIITANDCIGMTDFEEVVEGQVWTCTMTKQNEEQWKLTFIYHDLKVFDCWAQYVKDIKACIEKQALKVVGAPIEFDEINWVDKPYF